MATHPLETKRYLAYIPDQVMLYGNLTGVANLEYFAALAGKDHPGPERLGDIFVDAGVRLTRPTSRFNLIA